MSENNRNFHRIYIVAWEYATGGGFDWYFTEEAAKKAFKTEKANSKQFKDSNWIAYYCTYDTPTDPHQDKELLTEEISEIYYENIFSTESSIFRNKKIYSASWHKNILYNLQFALSKLFRIDVLNI